MSFGNELREQREDRGVTLAQVAEATRIPTSHLEALEEGVISALPGGIFNRGILQNYCRFLGINDAAWLERFHQEYGHREDDWTEFATAVKRNRAAVSPSSRSRWLGVFLMLLALGLLAWAAWQFILRPRMGSRLSEPDDTVTLSVR